jgi:superfamily I DNA/RNA helicase
MRNGRPAELVMGSVQLGLSYGLTNRTGKPPRDTALRLVRRAANAGVSQFDRLAQVSADVYAAMGPALKAANAMDFDDLLLHPLTLFREHPDRLQFYQAKFTFVP